MGNPKANKRVSNSNGRFLGNNPKEHESDKEVMANLVNFMQTLIQMDVQQKELNKQIKANKGGSTK